jgi:hypothetical protein
MADGNEARLGDLLRQAQTMMVELSGRCAGAQRDWDKAKALLDGARQIDNILRLLTGQGPMPPPVVPPVGRKLPYYYIEYDKLVKVGRSRDGGTYEHRVTQDHFDLIVTRLGEMARQGRTFETRRLVERCDVPAHEPLLVVNLLGEQGLLESMRRGQWAFRDAQGFGDAVRGVWSKVALHPRI